MERSAPELTLRTHSFMPRTLAQVQVPCAKSPRFRVLLALSELAASEHGVPAKLELTRTYVRTYVRPHVDWR